MINYADLTRKIESKQPATKKDLKDLILSIYPDASVTVEDYRYYGTVTGAIAIVNGVKFPSGKNRAYSIYK